MSPTLRREWPGVLAAAVALLYAQVGAAAQGWDRVWGLGGALVIVASLVAMRRSLRLGVALLVVGAVPLALGTWWSVVTPVLAVVVVTLGLLSARALGRDLRPGGAGPQPVPAGAGAS